MTHDPLDDAVARQYEAWVYPEPIADLPRWLEGNWQWFDPSHAHRVLWPAGDQPALLDILVAGCGTNQAAVLAYTNPNARVTGIDVSASSLLHHRHLERRYGLENLHVHQLPIERVGDLGLDFDLIVSTGVLHHMAHPQEGLSALATCLRPGGVMGLMLYARNGRVGVEMLADAFRDMGLGQDAQSVRVVRQVIDDLPPDHPVRSYLGIAPDLGPDAGVIDTFLHGRQRSYTVDECLELVHSASLVFQDWFLRAPYCPPQDPDSVLRQVLDHLPRERQWAAMEAVNTRNACHFFMACRPERPEGTYRIHFDLPADEVATWVPSLRYRCQQDGDDLARPDWTARLEPAQARISALMDGSRTIAQVARDSGAHPADVIALSRALWELDFLQVALPG